MRVLSNAAGARRDASSGCRALSSRPAPRDAPSVGGRLDIVEEVDLRRSRDAGVLHRRLEVGRARELLGIVEVGVGQDDRDQVRVGVIAVDVIKTNSIGSALNATIGGMGIGVLPCLMAGEERNLVRLFDEVICARPISLVTHADVIRAARVRTVWDYLIAVIEGDRALLSGVRA